MLSTLSMSKAVDIKCENGVVVRGLPEYGPYYTFTGKEKCLLGVGLVREIVFLKGDHAGEIGGWVYSENNIKQDDDSYISRGVVLGKDVYINNSRLCGNIIVVRDSIIEYSSIIVNSDDKINYVGVVSSGIKDSLIYISKDDELRNIALYDTHLDQTIILSVDKYNKQLEIEFDDKYNKAVGDLYYIYKDTVDSHVYDEYIRDMEFDNDFLSEEGSYWWCKNGRDLYDDVIIESSYIYNTEMYLRRSYFEHVKLTRIYLVGKVCESLYDLSLYTDVGDLVRIILGREVNRNDFRYPKSIVFFKSTTFSYNSLRYLLQSELYYMLTYTPQDDDVDYHGYLNGADVRKLPATEYVDIHEGWYFV